MRYLISKLSSFLKGSDLGPLTYWLLIGLFTFLVLSPVSICSWVLETGKRCSRTRNSCCNRSPVDLKTGWSYTPNDPPISFPAKYLPTPIHVSPGFPMRIRTTLPKCQDPPFSLLEPAPAFQMGNPSPRKPAANYHGPHFPGTETPADGCEEQVRNAFLDWYEAAGVRAYADVEEENGGRP
jgi:hypothetical protein